jgi:hypothetical protein
MNGTSREARKKPRGKPIWRTPVNRPRSRGGDSSRTSVPVIGDCTAAVVKPSVRAMSSVTVVGAQASAVTNTGVSRVAPRSTVRRPMRSASTPSCVMSTPAMTKVRAIYSPRSRSDQPNSAEISVSTNVNSE